MYLHNCIWNIYWLFRTLYSFQRLQELWMTCLFCLCNILSFLTHSFPVHPFFTPWKHQVMLSGIEKGCIGNEWVKSQQLLKKMIEIVLYTMLGWSRCCQMLWKFRRNYETIFVFFLNRNAPYSFWTFLRDIFVLNSTCFCKTLCWCLLMKVRYCCNRITG